MGWNDAPRLAARQGEDKVEVKRRTTRRTAAPKVQSLNQRKQDEAEAVQALEMAMVERQIEEDEKAAASSVASEPQQGTGYMVLALQEQLMQLKAQIDAIQHAPPAPPRDDDGLMFEMDQSAPPPPPPPFSPPIAEAPPTRRVEIPLKPTASLSDLIVGRSVALKKTAIPRSPGGTPARSDATVGNTNSPGKFIATALRLKFKQAQAPFSAVDDDDADWEENVPPSTPVFRSIESRSGTM